MRPIVVGWWRRGRPGGVGGAAGREWHALLSAAFTRRAEIYRIIYLSQIVAARYESLISRAGLLLRHVLLFVFGCFAVLPSSPGRMRRSIAHPAEGRRPPKINPSRSTGTRRATAAKTRKVTLAAANRRFTKQTAPWDWKFSLNYPSRSARTRCNPGRKL